MNQSWDAKHIFLFPTTANFLWRVMKKGFCKIRKGKKAISNLKVGLKLTYIIGLASSQIKLLTWVKRIYQLVQNLNKDWLKPILQPLQLGHGVHLSNNQQLKHESRKVLAITIISITFASNFYFVNIMYFAA